jgi:hypothetical protein
VASDGRLRFGVIGTEVCTFKGKAKIACTTRWTTK